MKKTKTDCLLFIPTGGGGAEKVSINIAKILKNNGLIVKIVFVKGATMNVMRYISDEEWDYDILVANNKLSRYIGITKFIMKYRPTTVFSSLTALSSVLIINKLFLPRLKVITRQCFMPVRGSRVVNEAIKTLFRFADLNIAQTEEMRRAMIEQYKLPDAKVLTINNPLDTQDILNKVQGVCRPESNSYRYIAIGRIIPLKGFDTLIKAFANVKAKHEEATLKIVGNADDQQYMACLRDLIAQLKLNNSVEIIGYTDNPYKELVQANCFVLSSIIEGLPNVMLESMFLNIPVAATKCIPYVSQNIINGVNGFTASVGNEEELSVAMEKAAELYGCVKNGDRNKELEIQLTSVFKK